MPENMVMYSGCLYLDTVVISIRISISQIYISGKNDATINSVFHNQEFILIVTTIYGCI